MTDTLPDPRIRVARFWAAGSAIGGGLAIVGAVLPWVAVQLPGTALDVRNGLHTGGDGYITAALGGLVIALTVRGWWRPAALTRRVGTIALIAGFFLLSIPAIRWADFRRAVVAVGEALVSPTGPEIGVYVTALGGLLAIVGGWQIRRVLRRPDPRRESAEPKRF